MKLFSLMSSEMAFLHQGLELNAPTEEYKVTAGFRCESVCASGCGANCSGGCGGRSNA